MTARRIRYEIEPMTLGNMRELGASREKLIEMFGFSGLSRYEKMLDGQERGAGKLIEGKVAGDEGEGNHPKALVPQSNEVVPSDKGNRLA